LKAYLQYDTIIIICDTAFGFVRYKAKNIVDRMLPLAAMYTHIVDGQLIAQMLITRKHSIMTLRGLSNLCRIIQNNFDKATALSLRGD